MQETRREDKSMVYVLTGMKLIEIYVMHKTNIREKDWIWFYVIHTHIHMCVEYKMIRHAKGENCLTWKHMQLRGEDGSKVVALNKKGRYQRTDREAFKGGGERDEYYFRKAW